ncbi:bacteriohemerythrin [Candidatus Riflebacteria bacterium]
MPYIPWKAEYSVKNGEIDHQHKKLFEIMEQLHAAAMKGESNTMLEETLQKLAEYTGYHFSAEEKMMQESSYELYENHKWEHESFVKKVLDFTVEFKDRKMNTFKILDFLSKWLKNHILLTDKKFGEFLKKRV